MRKTNLPSPKVVNERLIQTLLACEWRECRIDGKGGEWALSQLGYHDAHSPSWIGLTDAGRASVPTVTQAYIPPPKELGAEPFSRHKNWDDREGN